MPRSTRTLKSLIWIATALLIVFAALSPHLYRMLRNAQALRIKYDSLDEAAAQARELSKLAVAVTANPSDVSLRLNYAHELGKRRMYEQALAEILAAERLAPKLAEVHLAAADVYKVYGIIDLALNEERLACRLEPNNPRALAELAYTYLAMDWYGASEALLNEAIKRFPTDSTMHIITAEVRYQRREYAGALKHLLAARVLQPNNQAIDGPMIDVLMRLGNNQAALGLASRALTRSPGNARYALAEAAALRALGENVQALAVLKTLYQSNSGSPNVAYPLAMALIATRDDAAAVPLLEQISADRPNYQRTGLVLAQLYSKMGRNKDAHAILTRFNAANNADEQEIVWRIRVGDHPNNVAAHKQLGLLYYKHGNMSRAIVELREAERLSAPTNALEAIVADAMERAGRANEAASVRDRLQKQKATVTNHR